MSHLSVDTKLTDTSKVNGESKNYLFFHYNARETIDVIIDLKSKSSQQQVSNLKIINFGIQLSRVTFEFQMMKVIRIDLNYIESASRRLENNGGRDVNHWGAIEKTPATWRPRLCNHYVFQYETYGSIKLCNVIAKIKLYNPDHREVGSESWCGLLCAYITFFFKSINYYDNTLLLLSFHIIFEKIFICVLWL